MALTAYIGFNSVGIHVGVDAVVNLAVAAEFRCLVETVFLPRTQESGFYIWNINPIRR